MFGAITSLGGRLAGAGARAAGTAGRTAGKAAGAAATAGQAVEQAASNGVPGSQLLSLGFSVAAMIPAVVQLVQSFSTEPTDANADQLLKARDALAGRLAQETGMPMEQAHQMLSEHLGDAVQTASSGGNSDAINGILSGALAAAGVAGAYKGIKGMRAGKGAPTPSSTGKPAQPSKPDDAVNFRAQATAPAAAPLDPLQRPPTRDEMASIGVLEGRQKRAPLPPRSALPPEDYGAMERNRLLGSMYRYEGG